MARELLFALTLGLATGACDEGYEGEATAPRGAPRVVGGKPAAGRGARLLAKDRFQTTELCGELFSPEDVAAASGLDVGAQEMTPRGKRGCAIGDGAPFLLDLTVYSPKDSVQAAASLFEMTTINMTQADIEAAMLGVEERSRERNPTKKVDRERVASIAANMPTASYVDVEGIGDRARMTTGSRELMAKEVRSCTLNVLVRNVVFSVAISTTEELGEEVLVGAAKKLASSIGRKIASM